MKVNGNDIPDRLYTEDSKEPWTPTGAFNAAGLSNPRYTYQRTVDGKKQLRTFKPRHFNKTSHGKATAQASAASAE